MRQTWWALLVGIIGVVGLVIGGGCAGTGETLYLDVSPKQNGMQYPKGEPVKIVVTTFEDNRVEKGQVGQRTHLWGGVTNFELTGGKPGDVFARVLADTLQQRGWQDRAWTVTMPSSSAAVPADADIVISGQVLACSVHAKGRFFSTKVTAETKLVVRAQNTADRSVITRTVEGAESGTVFWFDPEDARVLLASTMKDSVDRFISDTKIENRALRPLR